MCGPTIKLSYSCILRRNIKVIKHSKRPAGASRPQRRGGVDPRSCRLLKSPDRNFESGDVPSSRLRRIHTIAHANKLHESKYSESLHRGSLRAPRSTAEKILRLPSPEQAPRFSPLRLFLLSAFRFPAASPSPSRAPTSPRCRRRRPQSCKPHARRPGNWI